jgi:hypothetical protein
MINKTLHRKLEIEQHWLQLNWGWTKLLRKDNLFLFPLVVPPVCDLVEKLWIQHTRIIHDEWRLLILSNEEKRTIMNIFKKEWFIICLFFTQAHGAWISFPPPPFSLLPPFSKFSYKSFLFKNVHNRSFFFIWQYQ